MVGKIGRLPVHHFEGRLRLGVLRGLALLFLFAFAAAAVQAAELVMFEAKGCPYCARWNAEIGKAYAKTEEGARLPLRRVDLDEPRPEDLKDIGGIRFTPTFVAIEQGREIGRIVGYLGEDQFYGMLGKIIVRLDEDRN